MHGSIPAAVTLAVIFLLWHLYELVERIRENRKTRQVNQNIKEKMVISRKAVVDMSKFRIFMSAASVVYAVVHVAEAE